MTPSILTENTFEEKRTKKLISNLARALSYELVHEYNNAKKESKSNESMLKGIESVLGKHFLFGSLEEESDQLNPGSKKLVIPIKGCGLNA